MTTDLTGRSFLSYRRSRIDEAKLFINAQHELGIPTWQDIRNLDEEPTEEAIRGVLNDRSTANAVLWLTPDVAESPMIQKVEAPLILERYQHNDGFFVVPVAAGGLAYDAAGAVLSGSIGIQNLKNWNLRKVNTDPISEDEARQIAGRVLQRRIRALHQSMAPAESLRIVVNTRQEPAIQTGVALTMNWTHRFDGRTASPDTWTGCLLPALEEVARVIQEHAPNRRVLATGLLSIPAATALGKTFLAPRRISIGWDQFTPGMLAQRWHLDAIPECSEFDAVETAGDVTGNDLAVMVSVNGDVTGALAASQHLLPQIRAFVHIKRQHDSTKAIIETPGQAIHLARLVTESARKARSYYRITGSVHLFMAVPVGLAMLIGQLLNTLGKVQTYEHIQEGATGHYELAALLTL